MAEKDINLKQVLKRFPPGDRWTPADADQPILSSLTEGIEWVFQQTKKHDFIRTSRSFKIVFIFLKHPSIESLEHEPLFLPLQVFLQKPFFKMLMTLG